MRSKRVLFLACGAWLSSCSGPASETKATPPVKVEAKKPKAGLRLVVTPEDAEVWIDKTSLGPANETVDGIIELSPGLHQVSVKKAGYETWRAEVAVREGLESLEVTLTPSKAR